MAPTVVTVCGGGNAAHVLFGLLACRPDEYECRVFAPFGEEAEKWTAAKEKAGCCTTHRTSDGKKFLGCKDALVTKDPVKALQKADVILFAVPAFAHGGFLQHVKESYDFEAAAKEGRKPMLGAMPGEGGFDMQAAFILGEHRSLFALFAMETLPWACRLTSYGENVEILGTKKDIDMAVSPPSEAERTRARLQDMIGEEPKLTVLPCMLTITLMNINSIWHPNITFGAYRDWDWVTPFDEQKLFYEGVDEWTGEQLSNVSNEVLKMKAALEKDYKLDLTGLRHVKDWMARSYAGDMADESSLRRMINTNKGYLGLHHPMTQVDGKWMPDFKARYVTEDVPFGLVVTKGIADLLGVETPALDAVIRFGEKAMGKSYLDEAGHVAGVDVKDCRAPQTFQFKTVADMVKACGY